jgi:hypothetical protein
MTPPCNYSDRETTTMTHHIRHVTLKATAGTGWHALQDQLEAAHAAVRSLALSGRRHGVLVTRHGYDSYSVALSSEVPYGMTYEREDMGTP